MDPAITAAAGAIANAHSCGACNKDFQDGYLRDFHGVPVCVDCYRDLGLLTLDELSVEPDEAMLCRLLSAAPAEVAPGPARRYGVVLRYASLLDPAGAGQLVLTAARGGNATGLQEVLWVLIAADALLRAGGSHGKRPVEGRDMSLLLNLSARVGMDIGWAAMVDAGVAKRSPSERGDEWVYEDTVGPGGLNLQGLAAEKDAFVAYIRALKAKVDILAADVSDRDDSVDIGVQILSRSASELLDAFSQMEKPRGKPGPET
jgi:hypothetical protein